MTHHQIVATAFAVAFIVALTYRYIKDHTPLREEKRP